MKVVRHSPRAFLAKAQGFLERDDKDLALTCLRIYNDWMIDEWCGTVPGRYIPLIIIPLWDPAKAAVEMERCRREYLTPEEYARVQRTLAQDELCPVPAGRTARLGSPSVRRCCTPNTASITRPTPCSRIP